MTQKLVVAMSTSCLDYHHEPHNIREKLYVLPEETHVLPGHGRATTIGHEKVHNPFVRP